MVSQSPINRCAMVLCFVAAGFLAAATCRDYVNLYTWRPEDGFRSSRSQRLLLMLTQAPDLLAAENIHLEISLSQRRLKVYRHDTLLQEFPVAVGKDDWETPTGYFAVTDMKTDPIWQHPITKAAIPPGPTNPLGARWIGFTTEDDYPVGIHGTNQDSLIGAAVSHGCVRMLNSDIQALYSLTKIGTPIVVKP